MRYVLPADNYKDYFNKPCDFSTWYDSHNRAKPFRDRVMKAINQLRFKSGIWQPVRESGVWNLKDGEYVGWDRVYRFVNDVRKLAGLPNMDRKTFEEGRRCRDIFTRTYKYSLVEFWLLCWGDW
jgi:hypothetical protein